MGKYRTLERHLHQLRDLQSIIDSMKKLAQLEQYKLSGLAETQHAMAEGLRQMTDDFLHYYPQDHRDDPEASLWLLLGSERGFCGEFNESLLRRFKAEYPQWRDHPHRVLAVGRRLCSRLEEQLHGFVKLAGASVGEELMGTLREVAPAIQQALEQERLAGLYVLLHGTEHEEVSVVRLLPPQVSEHRRTQTAPLLLQLTPSGFYAQFLQHYLLLRLVELFTVSLRAENRHREQHLDGALRRLDERLERMAARSRALRQEEITEEIEMILLGTDSYSPPR